MAQCESIYLFGGDATTPIVTYLLDKEGKVVDDLSLRAFIPKAKSFRSFVLLKGKIFAVLERYKTSDII